MIIVKLNSDNYKDQLCSVDAYERIVLEMSTGDVAMHTTELLVGKLEFFNDVLIIDPVDNEFIFVNTTEHETLNYETVE